MPKKERQDGTRPPIGELMRPVYVLQMNWPRLSDSSRVKWLVKLRWACLRTVSQIDVEIARLSKGVPF